MRQYIPRFLRHTRFGSALALVLTAVLAPHALAAEATLDTMITTGLGNLVKYARYGAIAILAGVFLWAWANKASNKDNTHTAHQMNAVMWLAGLGFIVVVAYKAVLRGFITFTGADPTAIPDWVWQS